MVHRIVNKLKMDLTHPMDLLYSGLNATITELNQNEEMFTQLCRIARNTSSYHKQLQIIEIFEVQRRDEAYKDNTNFMLENHELL